MVNFLFLATEAAEVTESHGFGLNFNLLESNIINLAIVIAVLFYFGRGFVSSTLKERRSKIADEIKDSETRQKEAAAALADAQQKLAQAQAQAEQIRAAAEESAKGTREDILATAARDVERLKEAAAKDLNAERERAIAQLRERVAALALQQVESQLPNHLDDSAQQQLIDRSISLLGGRA